MKIATSFAFEGIICKVCLAHSDFAEAKSMFTAAKM
jgi:hypothetical protein